MSIHEAAKAIGVSYWAILRMVKSGAIPGAKKCGRYVVSTQWVTDKVAELAALK